MGSIEDHGVNSYMWKEIETLVWGLVGIFILSGLLIVLCYVLDSEWGKNERSRTGKLGKSGSR